MPSAIERQWLILSLLPKPPRRIDSASLESLLHGRGYDVHRRTIQRDLLQLSTVFPIVADERQKPYGWRWSENARMPCGASASDQPTLPIRARVRRTMLQTVIDGLRAPNIESEADPLDAACVLLACTVDDTAATRRFLFGFASDLEILMPDLLRRELAERAGRVARLYGK